MTKDELIGLYGLISNLKSGKLSRDAQVKYIPLRMKLKSISDEFEKYRAEAVEQNKPDGYDELEDKTEANKELTVKVEPILREYLKTKVDIDTKIFTFDEAIDLIQSNPEIEGGVGDLVIKYLLKE